MKRIALLFVFAVLLFSSAFFSFVLPAAAGQGGDEIKAIISIFRPTPVERKVEVVLENQGYDLKFKNKIDTFTFEGDRRVNVYTATLGGNSSAVFLLMEGKEATNIIILEPEDMPGFWSFLKKGQKEKREEIISRFKKTNIAELK